jgi:hypothetical protein
MPTANKKQNKLKWFNIIESQTDYLLGSILCKLLTTNEPESQFSNVTLPNSFSFYSLLQHGIQVTLIVA